MKKTIDTILNHEHTEKFFVFLILLELVVCLFDTETTSFAAFKVFVNVFEFIVISVFTLEYVLRVFTMEKFKNIFKPLMMVDLLTILPVTGLIFVLAMVFSSVFICFAEQSTAQLALKKWPPSSLWSIVTFAIYSYDGTLPIERVSRFITSITPGLGVLAVCIFGALLFEFALKQYQAFNLKKMTIREEFTLIDI